MLRSKSVFFRCFKDVNLQIIYLKANIDFEKLVITRRTDKTKWDYRYENVCLLIDNIEKLCSSDGDLGTF